MKKLFITLGVIITVVVVGYFVVNQIIKGKVTNFLDNGVASNISIDYDDVDMNLFTGSMRIEDINIAIKNKGDDQIHTQGFVNYLDIEGVDYWAYLFDDLIKIDLIRIDKNAINYYRNRFQKPEDKGGEQRNPLAKIHKNVLVQKFEIGSSSLDMYNGDKDSLELSIHRGLLQLTNLRTDTLLITKRIPVRYDMINLSTDSIYYRLNKLEHLEIQDFEIDNNKIKVTDFSIVPDYSQTEFVQQISKERDYIKLDIPQIEVLDYDVAFKDGKLNITSSIVHIDEPDALIFRDKNLPDDTSIKPLYSEQLRELPFGLLIDSIKIKNGNITYQEKMQADEPSGEVYFSSLDATVAVVGNLQEPGTETVVIVNGTFQKQAQLHADWSFDAFNDRETFRFSGHVYGLPASNINSFTRPNLNVGFKGSLNEFYFDIDGNDVNSRTKLKMGYEDFKVELLKRQDNIFSDVLSGVANIFVSKDSKSKDDDYRSGSGEAQRDQTKSIFNFIWISLLSALIKTMT